MKTAREILGFNLRRMRKSCGMTQENLADGAGLSWAMIQQVETGHSWPSPETITKIAKALGVQEGALFEANQTKKTQAEDPTHKILEITEGLRDDQKTMIEEITRLNDELEFQREMMQKTFKLPVGLLGLLVKASPALLRDVEQFLRSRGLQQDSLRKSK